MLLGVFGLLFSAKHYERARMHTEALRQIRGEIDKGAAADRSLSDLTRAGRQIDYREFHWPSVRAEDPDHRHARSWLARQRLNVFWEAVHVLIVLIGLGLRIAIRVEHGQPSGDHIRNALIVEAPRPPGAPGPASRPP